MTLLSAVRLSLTVDTVLWRFLQHKFQHPDDPAWFCARVRQHLNAQAPEPARIRLVDIPIIMSPALLLVMFHVLQMHIAWFVWAWILWIGWAMVRIMLVFLSDILHARKICTQGRKLHARAVHHVLQELSAHERMQYLQYRLGQLTVHEECVAASAPPGHGFFQRCTGFIQGLRDVR